MRVLLDENLDHALRNLLRPHDVFTTNFMGWAGFKNGELLRAAEENGIDVFLTGDRTLAQEQNLPGRRLAWLFFQPSNCRSSGIFFRRSFLQLTMRLPEQSTPWIAGHSIADVDVTYASFVAG